MTDDEAAAISDTFATVPTAFIEGGHECIVLPELTLPKGCKPESAFAVYHRGPIGGYDSRLFFDNPVSNSDGTMPTIHEQRLLGKTMYAASIRGVPPTLPPYQAILAHLRVYQK